MFGEHLLSSNVTLPEVLRCVTKGFSVLTKCEKRGDVIQHLYRVDNNPPGYSIESTKTFRSSRYMKRTTDKECHRHYNAALKRLPFPSEGTFDLCTTYLVYKKRCEYVGRTDLLKGVITEWWSRQVTVDVSIVPFMSEREIGSLWLTLGTHLLHFFEYDLVPTKTKRSTVVSKSLRSPAIYPGPGGNVGQLLKGTQEAIVKQHKGIELLLSLLLK